MPSQVLMPKMGYDMAEGKILRWIKQEGDPVNKGEAIAEIETEKVNIEIEAFEAGTLGRILAGPGSVVPVGDPIAVILKPGEKLDTPPAAPQATPAVGAGEGNEAVPQLRRLDGEQAVAQPKLPPQETRTPGPAPGEPHGTRFKASPLARRIAKEMGVDLRDIGGTGPGGRIVKRDVMRARPAAPAPAALAAERVPLTKMRRAIARAMTGSKAPVPHFYVTVAVDMDKAMAFRKQLNDMQGMPKVSLNDLIVKAAALALKKFPNLNASYGEDAIDRHGDVNVSIAVALPEGLINPVLHQADRKLISEISRESKALAEAARNGRLKPEDVMGGTFTVSNLGMFDVENFSAIITPPQAAALAVASAQQVPVVRDGQLTIGWVMKATLSADHRVTDGAEGAQFMAEWKRLLEEPLRLVV